MSAGRVGLFVLALLFGCSSTPSYEPEPGPYDRIPEDWKDVIEEARTACDENHLREARARLTLLTKADPSLLPILLFLQDVELGLLAAGLDVDGRRASTGQDTGQFLGSIYAQRAEEEPGVEALVLAARLAPNGEDALELLARAEAIDPTCVWIHYGRAWWFTGMRRFPEARTAVERAFALDGGHLPTMRLHATMLAAAGETRAAIECLAAWLDRAIDDPLVDPEFRANAMVDLAALYVLAGEPAEAMDIIALTDLDILTNRARAELVRSAAYEDLGLRELALSAARRAKAMDPEGILPLVHQALLLQLQGNTSQEHELWQALLDEASAQWERASADLLDPDEPLEIDFQALIIQLQANARLERIERERTRRRGRP